MFGAIGMWRSRVGRTGRAGRTARATRAARAAKAARTAKAARAWCLEVLWVIFQHGVREPKKTPIWPTMAPISPKIAPR